MSGLFDQVVNYSPPLLTSGQVNYDGTWNAATNTPTLVSPPDALSKGDYYVVSAAGTQFGISFAVGDWIISNGTAWEKVDLTDAVSSVFGRTGAVVGDSTDYSAVGLTNTAIGAANPSTGAFTSLSSSSTTTLNGTTIPASKTLVVTTDKLSALAATTSAELAGVISDETGSGSLVFANSPTLVSPALGTPSALVGTNITGTAAAFNINGTVGATTPSTVAATAVTALSNSGYQAVVGQLTSGDRVGISGQSSGSGTALVFFDNAQTTFRPAIFDASSHSLKISGVEKASVTSTGLQGAIGATTPSTGAFTSLSSTSGAFNGTVGATAPSTVAATTLTTTGNLTIGAGADVFNGSVRISDNASANAPAYFQSGEPGISGSNVILSNNYYGVSGGASGRRNSSVGASYLRLNVGAASTSTATLGFISASGTATDVLAVNSTGAAVTGALSATGDVTTNGQIFFGGNYSHYVRANAGAASDLFIGGWNGVGIQVGSAFNTVANFTATGLGIGVTNPQQQLAVGGANDQVGAGVSGVVSTLYFGQPSNLTGGIARLAYDRSTGTLNFTGGTVAAPVTTMSINAVTGLAVTGALSATGGASITGAVSSANAFVSTGAVTANAADRVTLDFGSATFGRVLAWGPNNATAGQLDLGVLSANATVGSTSIARISATGLAVTGALSATGALAIGNTVNTVSPTSPNRTVTIVIGGTTYYLAAKTTND